MSHDNVFALKNPALETGESLDQFLDDFPGVARDVAVAVLERAREAVTPHAHSA